MTTARHARHAMTKRTRATVLLCITTTAILIVLMLSAPGVAAAP